jgi:hypothetical protein
MIYVAFFFLGFFLGVLAVSAALAKSASVGAPAEPALRGFLPDSFLLRMLSYKLIS